MQSLAGTWQNYFGTGKEGSKLLTLDYHSNMLFIFWVVNSRPPAAGTLYNQILTLFYTRGLEIVVSHMMVPLPYRFSLGFFYIGMVI